MIKFTKVKKLNTVILIIIFLLITIIPFSNGSYSDIEYINLNSSAPYNYYNYSTMTNLLFEIQRNCSDIMSIESLGKTYEGRDIWMVKLSDNVQTEEEEPGVLIMGAHHGDEKPSFEVPIYFIKFIAENYYKENTDDDEDGQINEDIIDGIDNDNDGLLDEDPSEDRVRNVIEKTQIYLIPMVNPDGVEYEWRKNREPNYGPDGKSDEIIVYLFPEEYYLDYITDDQSWTYRGEEPFSEKETQAVKTFVENHNLSISLSYHDYGEWMIFPWMHTSRHTPHESLFRSIGYNMSRINRYELKIYGQYGEREYLIPRYCGTPGSSENWLYGEHQIIAYTVELCSHRPEFNINRLMDALWKHVGVNLYICERSWTIEEEKRQSETNSVTSQIYDKIESKICSCCY